MLLRPSRQYEAQRDNRVFDHELVVACDSQLILIGKSSASKIAELPAPFFWFWDNRRM
jgi:hypothetical protein